MGFPALNLRFWWYEFWINFEVHEARYWTNTHAYVNGN
jgi:hypothetical protein